MNNRDAQIKEAARKSVSAGKAASTAMRPGAVLSGNAGKATTTAMRPRAVFVSSDRAAELDKRIAEKQEKVAELKASLSERNSMDRDMIEKEKARPSHVLGARPGAFACAALDASGHNELSALETDIAAKQRARRPSIGSDAKPGVIAVSSHLSSAKTSNHNGNGGRVKLADTDSDLAAKERARGPSLHSSRGAASRPGAFNAPSTPSGVHNLTAGMEDPVASKIRRSTPFLTHSLKSGVAVKTDTSMPGDVTSLPGATTSIRSGEDAVAATIRRDGPSKSTEKKMTTAATTPGVRSVRGGSGNDEITSKIRRETSSSSSAATTVGVIKQGPNAVTVDSVSEKIRANGQLSAAPVRKVQTKNKQRDDSVASKIRGASQLPNSVDVSEDPVLVKVRRDDKTVSAQENSALKVDDTRTIGGEGVFFREGSALQEENGKSDKKAEADPVESATDLKQSLPDYDDATLKALEKLKYVDYPEQVPAKQDDALVKNNTFVGSDSSDQGGLAVAIAVEDDDEIFIPAAIEYDPDSKPPIYKNRRFRLYGFLAIFVVLLVIIGAVIGATMGKKKDDIIDMAPTPAPTTYRESFGIETQIERLVGSELLSDPESPFSKALNWIMYDDPFQLVPEDTNFVQRFTASYLYFASIADGPWVSCNPPEDAFTDPPDCTLQLLTGVHPMRYTDIPGFSWLSNSSECSWAGITCDSQNQVRDIEVMGQNLTGTFPVGIYHFPFLQSLALSWNGLHGELPKELVQMDHLVSVELHYNKFTGTIPDDWWRARNLQRINLSGNFISGGISSEVEALKDLKGLFLFENELSGSLPEEFGYLFSLTFLRLSRNNIDGKLPETISNWKSIEELWLHQNQFSGSIPSSIGLLNATLGDFRLQENQMTGTLPEELYSLTRLSRLGLWNNSFSGPISPSIIKLSRSLEYLEISYNDFTGQLPREIANLTELNTILMEGNDIVGTVPKSLCGLQGGYILENFVADCLTTSDGFVEIDCICCTFCCEPDGNNCLPTN